MYKNKYIEEYHKTINGKEALRRANKKYRVTKKYKLTLLKRLLKEVPRDNKGKFIKWN